MTGKILLSTLCLVFITALGAQTPRLVVPIGHLGEIRAVAFSPDGKFFATCSRDSTAKLWDSKGRELQTFTGHKDIVNCVAFSPDGNTILTGSNDKTAKLWDLSGQVLQSFSDPEGRIQCIAFSPDGKTILTGSSFGRIKLWDLSGKMVSMFEKISSGGINAACFSPEGKTILTDGPFLWDLSGKFIRKFEGHAGSVTSVAFSSDGKLVLTGSTDSTAKLWDPDGRLLKTFGNHHSTVNAVAFSPDGKRILTGAEGWYATLWDTSGSVLQVFNHTRAVKAVAFSPNGNLVLTGSTDQTAALWDLSGRRLHEMKGYGGSVRAVAMAPDGLSALTGGKRSRLWDLSNGTARSLHGPVKDILSCRYFTDPIRAQIINALNEKFPDQDTLYPGHSDDVLSVAFSPDGTTFLTAGRDQSIRIWNLAEKKVQVIRAPTVEVTSAVYISDGKSVLAATNYEIPATRYSITGDRFQRFKARANWVSAVAFSPKGNTVLAGTVEGTILQWDVLGNSKPAFKVREYDPKNRLANEITSVVFSPDGKTVFAGSRNKKATLWDSSGNILQVFAGHSERINAVAFSPDGKAVLTGGGDDRAILWDLSGRPLQVFKGHSNDVNAVAFSADGNLILTGSEDNTAKIWERASGKEIATLVAIDTADWVVTTPSGLFDASPGAMRLLFFVVGTDAIDLEQLKERYYEPGLLGKLLGQNKDPLRSVEAFQSLALYPDMAVALSADSLKLEIDLTPRNGGIGKLSVFVNGKECVEDANPTRSREVSIDLTKFSNYYLPDVANKLEMRVYNEAGWLKSPAWALFYRLPVTGRGTGQETVVVPKPRPGQANRPALYAVVVGTSNYNGDQLDLKFADRDATSFALALRAAAPNVFGDQVFVTLLNTDPEDESRQGHSGKSSIREAFADIAAKAKAGDVLVIYFSGHGVNYGAAESGQFYYLTKDISSEDLKDPEVRANYAISSEEMTEWIKSIPALKQVLILDACNAGKIVEDISAAKKQINSSQIRALERMKDRTGMFILTGSAANKVSYEAGQYGQGLLTYSLLQGMSGLALTEDKRVDVMTLFQYARDKVPELAKGIGGIQTPVLAAPIGGASFDIGIVDANVRIPLAQVKPVFVRNNFTEEESFDDILGLTDVLENYFRALTVKGSQSDLIFVDVKTYEDAYSIKGRYTVQDDTVVVRGRLFKGKTPQGEVFRLSGNKNNLQAIVEAILANVTPLIN